MEVLQWVFFNFETLDRVAVDETGAIKLSDPISTNIQFFQSFQVFQTIDSEYFVVVGFEDLEFLQVTELQAIEVSNVIVTNIEYF